MSGCRWSVGRLIISIISIILFFLIAFQSCAAGVSNALGETGEVSGTGGLLVAILFLVSGIVGLVTRKSESGKGCIACCVMLWLGYLLSRAVAGSFSDLKIWGMLALIFGAIYLFSALQSKKGLVIGTVVTAVLFALSLV